MIRLFSAVLIAAITADSAIADTLTATRVVRPNSLIAPDDITIIEKSVAGAFGSETDIIGLEAKVMLYPGRPILRSHVGPPALVKRNQPVQVIFRHGALTISTDARALSRGAAGDTVRVMNLASRTTVSGQVQTDGSVVVLGGYNR